MSAYPNATLSVTHAQNCTLFFLSSFILHKLFPAHMHTNPKGDYFFGERYFPGLCAGSE